MRTSPIGIRAKLNFHKRGFTLLEVLIVLAIVSLIALAIPTVTGGVADSARLRNATYQLIDDLNAQQRRAATEGIATSVAILDPNVGYVLQPMAFLRDIPRGATIAFTPQDGQLARPDATGLTFQPGGVTTGGAFTLTLGSNSRVVEIRWPTGHVALN